MPKRRPHVGFNPFASLGALPSYRLFKRNFNYSKIIFIQSGDSVVVAQRIASSQRCLNAPVSVLVCNLLHKTLKLTFSEHMFKIWRQIQDWLIVVIFVISIAIIVAEIIMSFTNYSWNSFYLTTKETIRDTYVKPVLNKNLF